ncbi:hypothetical protein QYF36_027160 [Acer negundo]|nr:hypothetical protein QYF36_027160 [Acer negundo]
MNNHFQEHLGCHDELMRYQGRDGNLLSGDVRLYEEVNKRWVGPRGGPKSPATMLVVVVVTTTLFHGELRAVTARSEIRLGSAAVRVSILFSRL